MSQSFVKKEIDVIAIRKRIHAAFGGEFEWEADASLECRLPLFKHAPSEQRFRYIPGAQFRMGLSESEELAARAIFHPIPANPTEMRPVHWVQVAPFLMAERPVLNGEIKPTEPRVSYSVAYVSYEEALAYCQTFKMSLPSESQWEYACRAGSTTLFTWGDTLPNDRELAEWLTSNFSAGNGKANAFGLYGLFVGEWCSDFFTDSYDSPPHIYADEKVRVARAGGAYFWPWQDEEWVWCMSALRYPSTALDNKCCFRMVRNLPTE